MLDHLSIEAIPEGLPEESDGKAINRLVATRAYMDGNSRAETEELFGWPVQTIYSWLNRLGSQDLDEALHDESPPGHPSALTDDEFAAFKQAVADSLEAAGFDAPAWNAAPAQKYLRREFDQEYSRCHVRRLLDDTGGSWQSSLPQPPTTDGE